MELFKAIKKRHSYRAQFVDREIPESHLVKIVEAGILAPSGKNNQTTDFIIINKPELIREIAQIMEYPFVYTAKAMIVCVIQLRAPGYQGYSFEVEDCAAATENMLLAITACGYATVWIDGALRSENKADKIGKLMHVPTGKQVRIILPIGIPVEKWSQKGKKSFHERAWFNSYPVQDQ